MHLQHGDIAEPDDPFGMFPEMREIDLLDNPPGAIAAPPAQDGFDPFIIQHLLQIGQPLRIRTRKIIRGAATKGSAHFNLVAPFLQGIDAGLRFFGRHIPGRTYNADGIAFFQIGGCGSHA